MLAKEERMVKRLKSEDRDDETRQQTKEGVQKKRRVHVVEAQKSVKFR